MADTNVRFKISSAFEGEGFQAATKALKQNRQELSSSVKGLGELTKAFEDLSPQTAAAVSGVKTFVAAFTTGGIVGGVIELAIKGISKAIEFGVEKFNEAAEAAKKYAQILRDDVLTAMGDTTASFSKLCTDMDTANKEAKDLLSVLNGDAAHEAANKVFEVNVEKLNALANAMTDTEKGIVEATADYKIALIKAKEKEEEASNAIDAYRTQLDNAAKVKEAATARAEAAEASLAEASEKTTEYQQRRAMALGTIETIEKEYADKAIGMKDYTLRLKDARLNLASVEEKYKDDAKYLDDATKEAQKAREDATGAEYSYKQAQQALKESVQKHDEAIQAVTLTEREGQQKLEEAQKKDIEAKEKEAKARNEFSDYVQQLKIKMDEEIEERKGLSDSTKKLTKAQEDAAGSLDELYGDEGGGNSDTSKTKNVKVVNPGDIGTSVNTKIDMAGVKGEIKKPKGLDNGTFERIKKGQASVADFKRFDRFTEREVRDEQSSRHRIGTDAATFLKNADKPESWLSQRDIQFQNDFKTKVLPQLSTDVAKELLGEAGKHVLLKDDLKEFLGDECAIIKYLKKLGLQ